MKNQFFYTVKQEVEVPPVDGVAQPHQMKELRCSCNLDKVLLSIETPTGRTLVMDHMHEKEYLQPIFNKKRQKIGDKVVRGMFQTEILLNEIESAEYIAITSVNVD